MKFELGCLERWRFIVLQPNPPIDTPGGERRAGWGSGRGIHRDWRVRLAAKGHMAGLIWPPLFGEIEQRWEKAVRQG